MQARASLLNASRLSVSAMCRASSATYSSDVGGLDLVSGREPRSARIFGELPAERPDLDDKEAVDFRADAQKDR